MTERGNSAVLVIFIKFTEERRETASDGKQPERERATRGVNHVTRALKDKGERVIERK